MWKNIDKIGLKKVDATDRAKLRNGLDPGFLTGGTCTPWGYETPKQGVRDEASE